ncbi:MAG: deaminase [Opitutales bacterium]
MLNHLEDLVSKSCRPSWDEYFMAVAILVSARSSCERLNVGCVLVSDAEHKNRILAAGYNGFLAGVAHDSKVRDGHEQATVHAEQNAISDAARRGISIDNSIAYITHFPCINCVKILLSAGIKSIKYRHDYKNDPIALELIKSANVKLEKI